MKTGFTMLSKDADGMANSVDPDQSDLGLYYCPDLFVRKLRIIIYSIFLLNIFININHQKLPMSNFEKLCQGDSKGLIELF